LLRAIARGTSIALTWSIVARHDSGAVGVIVASRFFAVGALCPHARGGVGAVCTQALVNPHYGRDALPLLEQGLAPDAVVRTLTEADTGRDHRQLHLVDARGMAAGYTGSACIEWCGQLGGSGFSVAGNMLAGPQVLAATAARYVANSHLPFAQRLIAAMEAGEAAGGDKRGKQAAALLIYDTEAYPALDLRVDDHAEPLIELRRLNDKSRERFVPFVSCLPSKARPSGLVDRAAIEAEIERFHASLRSPSQ
jgi:uncharacterized Ntn-hydrolase superfamily protein